MNDGTMTDEAEEPAQQDVLRSIDGRLEALTPRIDGIVLFVKWVVGLMAAGFFITVLSLGIVLVNRLDEQQASQQRSAAQQHAQCESTNGARAVSRKSWDLALDYLEQVGRVLSPVDRAQLAKRVDGIRAAQKPAFAAQKC